MDCRELVSKMTLEEKAGLCSGFDFWKTKPIERLGVPSVMYSDGPHGLRKQADDVDHLGVNDSITAVCFPPACLTSCSFDRDLIFRLGEALGKECQAEDVAVILGPGMNIKRSPLCGRNFEYISEDPYLTGELAAAYIEGVQSQHVGTSVKHFAANNQEYERMAGSSEMDERTLREIYLAGFETAVKKAQPWTVMCSYNRINGMFSAENKWLLTDVLRDQWGFQGAVVTDWGAVCDRVTGLAAGLDLEMPGSRGENDREIVEAVRSGKLSESVLDAAAERLLRLTFEFSENRIVAVFDKEADHALAAEIAKQCMVLLKNDGVLPLREQTGTIACIGGFAEHPRYQGGGSSHINAYRIDSTLEAVKRYGQVIYAEGFSTTAEETDENQLQQAIQTAKSADVVVIFAGLPTPYESEGYDRTHMRLPDCQNRLIEEICRVHQRVVVVLHNGSPVEMPWADDVSGILEAYLGGEGGAEAIADILFGRANPGGKLPESFPLRVEDNPSYLEFQGTGMKVVYGEGVFVGYRYYDTKKMDVLFPFGHGLSYTTFELSHLTLDSREIKESGQLTVMVDVKNTGALAGKEVVQLYVRDNTGAAVRPEKELKGFEAVMLAPGETKTVTFSLNKRAFAWYNTEMSDWYAETGEYMLLVGNSSRNISLTETVRYISETECPFTVDQNTMLGKLLDHPKTQVFTRQTILPLVATMLENNDPDWTEMMEAMVRYMPLRAAKSFGTVANQQIAQLVDTLNGML